MADSGQRVLSLSRVIAAEAGEIFDLLADPSAHHLFDGSGTVVAGKSGNPERLSLGARFGMDMRLVIPYRMTSEVIEFEEDRLIAWRHPARHIWRYELQPLDEGTEVTESFDWATSRFPPFYEAVRYPAKHRVNIAETLKRLDDHFTG